MGEKKHLSAIERPQVALGRPCLDLETSHFTMYIYRSTFPTFKVAPG